MVYIFDVWFSFLLNVIYIDEKIYLKNPLHVLKSHNENNSFNRDINPRE